jgi:(R,R)-butanediol dehydrogenase/meso-butanediol dehydrogenase/diacetyl reductase
VRAAVFSELNKPLKVEDVPDPVPGPLNVLIKVAASGVCGSDIHATEDPAFGLPAGSILGHEYAGEVVAIGDEVSKVTVGDRVVVVPIVSCGECGPCRSGQPAWCTVSMRIDGGGFGQYASVAEDQCVRMPADMPFADGALVEPLAVGLHAVNMSELRTGARVLVMGAGPIGLAVTFWLRRLGAGTIAVAATSTWHEALATEMGADIFVADANASAEDIRVALGGPPEVVFECVGRPGMVQRGVEYVAPRGVVVIVGLCSTPDVFSPLLSVVKECRIQPSAFYDVQDFHTCLAALASGGSSPRALITSTVALDDVPQHFEALRSRTNECKVIVAMDGEA